MSKFTTTTKPASTGDFEKAPIGQHVAALVAFIDLGTHLESFQGGDPKPKPKIFLVWELCDEAKEDGTNHTIGLQLNFSWEEKATYRKLIEAWRGKPFAEGETFDPSALLGKPCLLNVADKNGYPYVANAGTLPKGMTGKKPTYKPFLYEIGVGPLPLQDWLPYIYGKTVREKIEASQEMTNRHANGQTTTTSAQHAKPKATVIDGNDGDEVPF